MTRKHPSIHYPLLSGTLVVPKSTTRAVNATDVCFRLRQMLSEEQPGHTLVTDNSVWFSGGLFRYVWTGNFLTPIGSGMIEVEDDPADFIVQYRISFFQFALFSVAAAFIPAISIWRAIFSGTMPHASNFEAPVCFLLMFLGFHYFSMIYRFPHWLRAGLVSKAVVQA